MLGRNHGMLGIAAFGGSVWYGQQVMHLQAITASEAALGIVVAAGAALAPDLDESESLGGRANPISELPIFGGHRTRTHTIATALLVTVVALLCERNRMAAAILVGFTACMGGSIVSTRLRQAGALLSVPFGIAAGYVSYKYVPGGWWLVAAVALPYFSHLLADSLTKGGVPLLMPITKHKYTLGLMKTGHFLEQAFFTPIIFVGAMLACWVAFSPNIHVWQHSGGTVGASWMHRLP